jgi:transposase InsO family protein
LGDVAGAPDCPVRPSIAACPNDFVVVEGYKYPNHHHSKHPSFQHFTFNTRAELDTCLIAKTNMGWL